MRLTADVVTTGESGAVSKLAAYLAGDVEKPLLQLHRTKIAIRSYSD